MESPFVERFFGLCSPGDAAGARIAATAAMVLVGTIAWAAEPAGSADWPSWRGDGSGASHCGAEMVDSLDQAKLAWQSDPVGLSGCMYPGGFPGEGWCDPIVADGRVFVYWFRRAGPDTVDMHALAASAGWLSLIEPPEEPEAFSGKFGGHRTSLPSKEMCAIQRFVRADDIVTCLDDRTGKKLWERVFHARGMNQVRVYGPLCEPCVRDGVLYALGSSGRVYALDAATGKTLWESDIGQLHERLEILMDVAARSRRRGYDSGWLNTGLVAADGVVATCSGSDVVGLDAATGRRLWRVPDCQANAANIPGVWRHNGKEYFLAAGHRMVLIEPKTGRELWTIGGTGWGSDLITDGCAPAISGDFAVVAKNVVKTVGVNPAPWWRGPSCYRLSLEKAERVWARPMVEGISLIAPAIDGKYAYVCADRGVVCVELETGKETDGVLPRWNTAYDGYAASDGLLFKLGRAGKGYPEMKELPGKLPGKPDFGEIHAPAMANGRVYWRGQHSVWCYDFRKNPPAPSTATLPVTRDLGAIRDDPEQLAAVIEKEGWPTRAAAADLLRDLGGKGKPAAGVVQKLLLAAIAAKDWGDTDLLSDTLMEIDPAAAKPAAAELAKFVDATDYPTWRLGCHGLALLGPQAAEAAPALAKRLDPAKPEQAVLAARTLGRIGPGAAAAVPDLLRCLPAKVIVPSKDLWPNGLPKFAEYVRLDTAEARRLTQGDKCYAGNDRDGARQAYEAFLQEYPKSRAGDYAKAMLAASNISVEREEAERIQQQTVTFHSLQALYRIGSIPRGAMSNVLEQTFAHPMFAWAEGVCVARRDSYRCMVMSRLGKEALPILLDRAKKALAAKERLEVADLTAAAFVIEPKSLADFMPIVSAALVGDSPLSNLELTKQDLEGTLNERDPWGRHAARKKAAEEASKAKAEIPEL